MKNNEPAHIKSPAIDQAQLASLRQIQQPGEADFVTELIDLFLNEAVSDIKALHEARASDDAEEIRRLAHRLKGSSANMGATQIAVLAEKLESKDPAKDVKGLLAQLENEFELVCAALNTERKETENNSDSALCEENRKRSSPVEFIPSPSRKEEQ